MKKIWWKKTLKYSFMKILMTVLQNVSVFFFNDIVQCFLFFWNIFINVSSLKILNFPPWQYTIIQFSDFDIYATTNTYNDTGYKYKIEHDQWLFKIFISNEIFDSYEAYASEMKLLGSYRS